MVIYDFDVQRARFAIGPNETNTPLRVDADAELPGPISAQSLKAIAW